MNNFLHSMFSQVDVTLGDTLITPSAAVHPYRAYFERVFNTSREGMESKANAALYTRDTAGETASNSCVGSNEGLKDRYDRTKAGAAVEMMGGLHSDIFFQNRFMLPGVPLKVRLMRSSDAFALLSAETSAEAYQIELMKASLFVRKVKVAPSMALAHEQKLLTTNAKYPITRVECKVLTIGAGQLDYTHENLFLGQLPKRIIIGMVDTGAYNGDIGKTPFNFENFDLKSLAIHVDGMQVPWAPLELDFATDRYIRGYYTMFTAGGSVMEDVGTDITRDTFKSGNALYCFDLTPDLSSSCSSHFSLVKRGTLRLGLRFGVGLPATVNVVVYSEFDNVIEVTKDRNVIHDYSN